MPKYKPKIGKEFDLEEEQARQQLLLERSAFWVGVLIILAFLVFLFLDLFLNVRIEGIKLVWMSAILAFGIAAGGLGLAGTFSVQFRKAGWIVKGTLGFGLFALVFLISVFGTRGR